MDEGQLGAALGGKLEVDGHENNVESKAMDDDNSQSRHNGRGEKAGALAGVRESCVTSEEVSLGQSPGAVRDGEARGACFK